MAALLVAIGSVLVPIVGTLIALALAGRASELIRESRGTKGGAQYVTAARIVAGAMIAFWMLGLVVFFALRGGNSPTTNDVAVPTQPPASTTPVPTTFTPSHTTPTTTRPKTSTTSAPKPTISVVPLPPTQAPATTAAPTLPPATQPAPTSPPPTLPPPTHPPVTTAAPTLPPPTQPAPTTAIPTTAPAPTTPPTTATPTTTRPPSAKAEALQARLLTRPQLGPSNRAVPNPERFVVTYTPGKDLLVTWAINNGTGAPPTGTASCAGPPTTPPTTAPAITTIAPATTIPPSTTATATTVPTSTTLPTRTTPQEARYEAQQILLTVRKQLTTLKLRISGLQLVGTYPITGTGETDVVQVLYSRATVEAGFADYAKAFTVPPAKLVQCLNPAFR